jgi:hypothetical protein
MKTIHQIDKNEVLVLAFPEYDVLDDESTKEKRMFRVNRALLLGNLYKQKVKIFFRSKNEIEHTIETTVWGITEKYVLLKGHLCIPINAISTIEFH